MIITKTIRAGKGVRVNPFLPEAARLVLRVYDDKRPVDQFETWKLNWLEWKNVQLVIARRPVMMGDPFTDANPGKKRPRHISAAIIPGTNQLSDWRRGNLNFFPHEIGGVPGLWRRGFQLGGQWAWSQLKRLSGRNDALIIAGHSLGGGEAKSAAAFAARDGDSSRVLALVDFAGPRTTNAAGAEFLNQHYPAPIGQRVDYGFDIVPWSVGPLGWRHALEPLCISGDGTVSNEHRFWRELRLAMGKRGLQAVGDHAMAHYARWASELPVPLPND